MNTLLRYFMVVILVCHVLKSHAQARTDRIYNKDGAIISAKVLEVLPLEIKYKKASNPGGPTYTILKSDVIRIVYANGEEELMAGATTPAAPKEEIPFGADNFLIFSDDGTYMISDLTLADKNVYLCQWDYDMKLISKYPHENRQINTGIYYWQKFTRDGSYLLNSTLYNKSGGLVSGFVNPETREPFYPQRSIGVVSPSGERVLFKTKASSETIYVFDGTGKLVTTNKFNGEWITNIRFSPSGNLYLVVRRSSIFLFDLHGNQLTEIEMGKYRVSSYEPYNRYGSLNLKSFVDFSYDDQFIIAPNDEEVVSIWDTKGVLVRNFDHYHATHAAISRDGKRVVTAGCLPYNKTVKRKAADGTSQVVSGGKIKVWSIDGTLVKEIPFPLNISSVAFAPDNSGIVVIAEEVPIWLWAEDNYSLEEGMDVALDKLAVEVAAAKEADRKADNRERWGLVLQGFVEELPKALNNMSQEKAKTDKQRKRINDILNNGQSTSGTGSNKRKGQRLEIAIANKTNKNVESVYISPKESRQWSEDILGKDMLFNGEVGTITIPSNYGNDCSFDMQVVYPDGKKAIWAGLDFCKYYTFQLFPNGKVVFTVD